jgi:hypothetical protein
VECGLVRLGKTHSRQTNQRTPLPSREAKGIVPKDENQIFIF